VCVQVSVQVCVGMGGIDWGILKSFLDGLKQIKMQAATIMLKYGRLVNLNSFCRMYSWAKNKTEIVEPSDTKPRQLINCDFPVPYFSIYIE